MTAAHLTALAAARLQLTRRCDDAADPSWLQATQWVVAEQEADDLSQFTAHDLAEWLRDNDHIAVANRTMASLIDNVFESCDPDDEDMLEMVQDVEDAITTIRNAIVKE